MPVYCKVVSNEAILDLVSQNNYQKVLIIGCGGCMNESLAYDGDLILKKKGMEEPYATKNKLDEIKNFLCEHHYAEDSVKVKVFPELNECLCMSDVNASKNEKDQKDQQDREFQPDVVLLLSCISGLLAWRAKMPEHNIMCITEIKGGLSYYFEEEDSNKRIIKEKSKIITRKWE